VVKPASLRRSRASHPAFTERSWSPCDDARDEKEECTMKAPLDGRVPTAAIDGDGLDPLLAVQLSDRPRYDAWPGEARLALAVLEDAIMTVRMTAGVEAPRARRLAAEARAWLTSRDTAHPFAFENLCITSA
jgi:hypothetical protein